MVIPAGVTSRTFGAAARTGRALRTPPIARTRAAAVASGTREDRRTFERIDRGRPPTAGSRCCMKAPGRRHEGSVIQIRPFVTVVRSPSRDQPDLRTGSQARRSRIASKSSSHLPAVSRGTGNAGNAGHATGGRLHLPRVRCVRGSPQMVRDAWQCSASRPRRPMPRGTAFRNQRPQDVSRHRIGSFR